MKTYKNKITFTCIVLLLNCNSIFAQLKVLTNGNVGVGTFSPIARFHMLGDAAVFTSGTGIPASCAFIRGHNNFSTADKPDYTWYYNDVTGIFHPSHNTIAFSVGAVERVRITESTYKLIVYGNAQASGGMWVSSDKRFKKNIKSIDGALNKVLKMSGASYEYKTAEFKSENFSTGKSLGFIAQELKEILPEAVKADTNGFLSVNYDQVIPVLVEAIKEQQKQIQQLQKDAEHSVVPGTNAKAIESSVLEQNKPNPFSASTEIKCYVAKDALNAALYIYDMQGTQIRKISISGRGEISTIIQGSELKAGMYLYTLIIDGKDIDTKRMILTN